MGELRFRVLGPVEVLRDGRPVALGGRPSVNLLAGLMLSANQPVSYDRLVGIVWGSRLPDHPQAALQSLTSRLRRVLGGAVIQTAATGYRLAVDDDTFDLLRFERLIGVAATATASGGAVASGEADPGEAAAARAVAAIDQALGLWDPPVLANVHSEMLLREGVGYLTERYLSAQEKRAALQLRLGRHRAMIGELGRLVAAHPFREDLVGLLMRALYRSHRQADALTAYQRLRHELRESLGVDPSEPLQRLHLAILRRDAGLDPPAPGPNPPAPGPNPPAPNPDPPAPDPDPAPSLAHEATRRSTRVVPRQLPPDTGDFTGRGEQLAAIQQALAPASADSAAASAPRVVVLAGPGGIGKSVLAVRAAHQLSAACADGRVYLDAGAAGIRPVPPADLTAELLLALGVPQPLIPHRLAERVGQYRSLVAGRRFLLILDHVASEAQVRDLLPPGPNGGVIVCARRRLAGFPGARIIDLDGLDETDARALLGQIIGHQRLSQEPGPAAGLIRLCAGLPLALRIAGARLAARPHWRLATLVRRLADDRRRLDELVYGDLSVRATISASYAGLPPRPRHMLRLLAGLEAPEVPLWAAAAVLHAPRASAEELCDALVDARLLQVRDVPSGPRYLLPDLVRVYARDLGPHPAPSAKIETRSVPRPVRETRTSRPCFSRTTSPAAASRSQ